MRGGSGWTRQACGSAVSHQRLDGFALVARPPFPQILEVTMKLNRLAARTTTGVLFALLAFVPNSLVSASSVAMAQSSDPDLTCTHVGGALMTNIGAVAGVTNLGPVFGDLAGSVAATILGQNANGTFNVQHYW